MTTSDEKHQPRTDGGIAEHSRVSPATHGQIIIDVIAQALGGRWVTGRFQDHHGFCAKVYAGHALYPSYELGTSCISKLEVWQLCDGSLVAAFDRGWAIQPRTKAAQEVVDSLAASLATRVFPALADSLPDKQPLDKRRTAQEHCPFCETSMASIDMHRGTTFESQTLKCDKCHECFLHVRHDDVSAIVHLPKFLERRGDAPEQRPLHDRTMAQNLVSAMVCDEWPSPATCVDFGLSTPDHYVAMQQAVREGLASYELDRVLGNGKAITQLVSFARHGEHSRSVEFSTPYDELQDETISQTRPSVRHKHGNKLTLDF